MQQNWYGVTRQFQQLEFHRTHTLCTLNAVSLLLYREFSSAILNALPSPRPSRWTVGGGFLKIKLISKLGSLFVDSRFVYTLN